MAETTSTQPSRKKAGLTQRMMPQASFSQPQWIRAARWPMATHLLMASWFWAFIIIAWIGAAVLFSQINDDGITMSIMQFVQHGALWFPFSISIMIAIMAPLHIANGVTRRSYARAAIAVTLATAVLYGLLIATAMSIEGVIYDAAGWQQQHVAEADGQIVGAAGAPWTEGWIVSALTYILSCAGGLVSGLLVGGTYHRFGGWKGTLLLPLTLIPALLGQADLARVVASGLDSELLIPGLLTLLIVAIGAFAYARIVHTVPISKKWSMYGE